MKRRTNTNWFRFRTPEGNGRLSADEENQLGQLARSGDKQARERLVLGNVDLAINLSLRVGANYQNRDDRQSEAFVGLVEAANGYDPDSGNRFSTLAWKIIRGKLNDVSNDFEVVPLPIYLHRILQAEKIGRSHKLSADRKASVDDGRKARSVVVDREYDLRELVDSSGEVSETSEYARSFLNALSGNEKAVVSMRFGIDGPAMMIKDIAKELGTNRRKVVQIYDRAIDHMQRHARRCG